MSAIIKKYALAYNINEKGYHYERRTEETTKIVGGKR